MNRLEKFKAYLIRNKWREANCCRNGLEIYIEPYGSEFKYVPYEFFLPESDDMPGTDAYINHGIEILCDLGVDMLEVPV